MCLAKYPVVQYMKAMSFIARIGQNDLRIDVTGDTIRIGDYPQESQCQPGINHPLGYFN